MCEGEGTQLASIHFCEASHFADTDGKGESESRERYRERQVYFTPGNDWRGLGRHQEKYQAASLKASETGEEDSVSDSSFSSACRRREMG